MNRQYSGDTRDLFKIDLVFHIMKGMTGLHSFTFVPMLTDDGGRTGKSPRKGRKDLATAAARGKAGSSNAALLRHMARLQEIESDKEYFYGILSLFKKENIRVRILEEPGFTHRERSRYFSNLFENFPERTLLFLDPDIGLEVKNATKRHLLFKEVKEACDRMDRQSVLMIYQHIPRVVRDGYIRHRCSQLEKQTGRAPVTITDNEIVFFLLVKDPKLVTKLKNVIEGYCAQYPCLR
jgi:hypothetical protein